MRELSKQNDKLYREELKRIKQRMFEESKEAKPSEANLTDDKILALATEQLIERTIHKLTLSKEAIDALEQPLKPLSSESEARFIRRSFVKKKS